MTVYLDYIALAALVAFMSMVVVEVVKSKIRNG